MKIHDDKHNSFSDNAGRETGRLQDLYNNQFRSVSRRIRSKESASGTASKTYQIAIFAV